MVIRELLQKGTSILKEAKKCHPILNSTTNRNIIIDELSKTYSAVVEEVNKMFTIGEVQKVMQGLLKEQVSIRNTVAILETIADYGAMTKSTELLVEKVRQRLGRQICLQYCDENKV